MTDTQTHSAPRKAHRGLALPTAALALADGTVLYGQGIGATGRSVGEVCFNTSITGYQEIITDPSYAGQIITFTFPHVGNVGTNDEDVETDTPSVRGVVLRMDITNPSNWRSVQHLDSWLKDRNLVGIAGVDTRALTRRIRDNGAPNGVIVHNPDGVFDEDALVAEAAAWPGLEGMDLAKDVTCAETHAWTGGAWSLDGGYAGQGQPARHVVAMDFGCKHNILRCLVDQGCSVTVVPASTSAEDVLALNPDGIFLSNGPGDPAATGEYVVPELKKLLTSGKPIFGICLGHQMLSLALGGETEKMPLGHRGANQPVLDTETGKVEITSQNHGFVTRSGSFPVGVTETHKSLFDNCVEGLRVDGKPVFSVQYHPEASPGPKDSHYLFKRFVDMIDAEKN